MAKRRHVRFHFRKLRRANVGDHAIELRVLTGIEIGTRWRTRRRFDVEIREPGTARGNPFVRFDIRRTGSIKKGDEVIGNETRVKVVKNKMAPPFKEAHFEILYNEGISKPSWLMDLGVENGMV